MCKRQNHIQKWWNGVEWRIINLSISKSRNFGMVKAIFCLFQMMSKFSTWLWQWACCPTCDISFTRQRHNCETKQFFYSEEMLPSTNFFLLKSSFILPSNPILLKKITIFFEKKRSEKPMLQGPWLWKLLGYLAGPKSLVIGWSTKWSSYLLLVKLVSSTWLSLNLED